jgi:hypothetical protein
VYINDELFTERTWIWREHYLNEMLQIQAEPGVYRVRVEAVRSISGKAGKFRVRNHMIDHGPAQWIDHATLEILP